MSLSVFKTGLFTIVLPRVAKVIRRPFLFLNIVLNVKAWNHSNQYIESTFR